MDSIAGAHRRVVVGDRIAYIDSDDVSVGVIRNSRMDGDGHEWLLIEWDDGFDDEGEWRWPSTDLKRVR